MKSFVPLLILAVGVLSPVANASASDDLTAIAHKLDEMLFDQAFNDCDTDVLTQIVADDLEFFHDKSGKMSGKRSFIDSIESGICELPYKATRQLSEAGLTVYPLRKNEELYGLIVQGKHEFFAKYDGKSEREKTSTANFMIYWELQNDKWMMKRVFSYNH